MRDWWETLAPRERGIVLVGGTAAAAAAVFLLLIEPALERREVLSARLQEMVNEHAWVEAQVPAVRARAQAGGPGPSQPARGGSSPLAVVDASARSAGLGSALRRVRPLESGVEAELEGAAYAPMMRWLASLETQYGLRVTSLGIDPGPEPGRVNAQLRVVDPAGIRP